MASVRYFFIINEQGAPIVLRGFLGEESQIVVENFFQRLQTIPPPQPVFRINGIHFAYTLINHLFFVAASTATNAPILLLQLLHGISLAITNCIGQCSEISMQRNLALVYEIVDETISLGFPQTSDSNFLLEHIHNIVNNEVSIDNDIFPDCNFDRPLALSKGGIDKTKNDVYLILKETFDLSLTSKNKTLRSTITGNASIKSYLQGKPSILIQLDNQVTIASRTTPKNLTLKFDDICFAPFVQTHAFDTLRYITFSPPSGESNIFQYRTSIPPQPPFTFSFNFDSISTTSIIVSVDVHSTYVPEITATNVNIIFQCPLETVSANCEIDSHANGESFFYDSKNRQAYWRIEKIGGMQKLTTKFHFFFEEDFEILADKLLGPINVKFDIENFLVSGLSIKNFLVATQGCSNQPKKYVKFSTTGGCFSVILN